MNRTVIVLIILCSMILSPVFAASQPEDKLPWWPTDAQPAPVKDEQRGGFWWWPSAPGTSKDLWGNRGYAYVNKIIYDWHGGSCKDVQVNISDVGFLQVEKRPSLLVKRIIRSQKLQFKDGTASIRPEHIVLLKKAAETLKRNGDVDILITAQNDPSAMGMGRIQAVEQFLLDQGVTPAQIKVMASGKFLEAGLFSKRPPEPGVIVFVIAEVKEVMIPGPKSKLP